MNFLQLILKQMRQRALSSWLTLLSVTLGVALATSILLLYREGDKLFVQADFGYDILVGAKGSDLQLVMNSVYYIGQPPGTIPYSTYKQIAESPEVKWAVPLFVSDFYKGYRVVGTSPTLFGKNENELGNPSLRAFVPPEYGFGKRFELASGQVFEFDKFEAVIGSEAAGKGGLALGSKFKVTHGAPTSDGKPDEHDEQWTVVGILKPTHTAHDRAIFIPLFSSYAVPGHAHDMAERTQTQKHDQEAHHEEHYTLQDDHIVLKEPQSEWQVSAGLVRATSSLIGYRFAAELNQRLDFAVSAANPARVMGDFYRTFFRASTIVLLLIALLVSIVAAVSILVSIYNSVSARRREIAILRALGATREKILALICVEAGIIGLVGGVLGMLLGHGLGLAGSLFMQHYLGQGIDWLSPGALEGLYLLVVVVLAVLAGLVPATKAYKTPVATNLVAG